MFARASREGAIPSGKARARIHYLDNDNHVGVIAAGPLKGGPGVGPSMLKEFLLTWAPSEPASNRVVGEERSVHV